MLFWNLQFLPTYAKWRRELQQLSEYFQILKIIFSCNYLDISDKFGLNFGPNNLYNCPNSLVHVLLSSVQLLSHVWLFETPWITARQASLSITISQSSLKFTSIESVMPSSHLILCRPLLLQSLPASESFPMSQLFASGGQSTGVSALASFLPKNTQGWSLLELPGGTSRHC